MNEEEQNPSASPNTRDIKDDFRLERYKYILRQIQFLNESLHKYLALFQALATAIVGAGVAVFVGVQKIPIRPEIAVVSINGLLWLLIILAVFVVISILAGIFSWFDYRNEEVELVGRDLRNPPKLRNLWRWYETWMIVIIIIFVAAAYYFTKVEVIPQINLAKDQAKMEQGRDEPRQ